MHTFKVVSDLICPWCYIGKRRLEAALRELPDGEEAAVSWHPFQLNPDMPEDGMVLREYCIRKFGSWEHCETLLAQISEAGRAVGIEFKFESQRVLPNTFDAHRVIWLAGLAGVQDAVVEALFRAYFCEGIDLRARSLLIEVAASGGLDADRVERFLESDEGVARVRSEESEIKKLGVSSVPLFIIQDHVAVSGAQPPETILKAFEEARELQRRRQKPRRGSMKPVRDPKGCSV